MKKKFKLKKQWKAASVQQTPSQCSNVSKVDNQGLSKEIPIWKQKASRKAVFSRFLFSEDQLKDFLHHKKVK